MCRVALENTDKVQLMAINDPFMEIEYMIYQLRYDSVHGQFKGTIESENGNLVING